MRTPRSGLHPYVKSSPEARKEIKTKETQKDEEDGDGDPNDLRATLMSCLRSMSLHTIDDKVKHIEERVTDVFATQQTVINKVEDKVE